MTQGRKEYVESGIGTSIFPFLPRFSTTSSAYGGGTNCTLWFGSILRKEMRDWAPYDPRRFCADSASVPVHQTRGRRSAMLPSSRRSQHFTVRRQCNKNEPSRKSNAYSFSLRDMPYRWRSFLFRSTFLLTIRGACFMFGASLSPTIAISCFYTCSTQAFHPGINCLSCPSTKGKLMYSVFLSCLHQSLPIGVRTQTSSFKHQASSVAWY